MPDAQTPRPTDAELEILQVLWANGPCTVKQVHVRLQRRPLRGYTTVLKLLQIMSDKGLVERDERSRAHVYSARVAEEETLRRMTGDLVDRAFGGSAGRLIAQALSARPASREELEQIRRLLGDVEE